MENETGRKPRGLRGPRGWRWLRRLLKGLATLLLFVLVFLCLAPLLVPPFLDRVYYRGPVSDHFDGRRFFNPSGEPPQPIAPRPRDGNAMTRMMRFFTGEGRATCPDRVAVRPTVPAARVEGDAMRVTWIGHATVLVQTRGINILTDPIWSEHATPFPPIGPRRVREPGVRFEDLPKIDLVLVSHNHYDHMDVPTLKRLWERDRPLIVSGLGNDAIAKRSGIAMTTRDWGGRVAVKPGVEVVVERVHHWDSRWGVDRNRALWAGFTVRLPGGNLFFAGDTGFGDGIWADMAARRGAIRLAILPIGAFQPREVMANSHIGPVEAVALFERLHAARALAMHWGTFQLSNEAIGAPPALLARTLAARGVAADRFRAIEVGRGWDVPAIR